MSDEPKCPYPHEKVRAAAATATGYSSKRWWPKAISLDSLIKNNPKSNPMNENFDYSKEFESLNLQEVKDFIRQIMKDDSNQYFWAADWGHYGPLFIRLAWHSAGTYRVSDGRGGGGEGMIRFAPLNSWPDNANLDKARRILWPVKEKFGQKISWADLIILAGNVALEDMGLKTFGFAGGREDVWEADTTYWGQESEWLANERNSEKTLYEDEKLENPLAAVQMGLIYVNPEGPDGIAEDFSGSAKNIRETFARMAMNDEETVALVAGGHAFGKAHGAVSAFNLGPEPEGGVLEDAGLGWVNVKDKGNAEDTTTSGLEGAWTPTPLKWDNKYLEILYKYEWEKVLSPAGAQQWSPIDCHPEDMVPDAHIKGKMNKPMMLTTDLALRFGDEGYNRICKKFLQDFDYFSEVFARAWFKLTHRDMGPVSRYLGSEIPKEILVWQDPITKSEYPELTQKEINNLRGNIALALDKNNIKISYTKHGKQLTRSLNLTDLIFTAWVSASTYRDSDKRGGANGARVLLEPMRSWKFTDYERVEKTVELLLGVKNSLNIKMSTSDLIVFGGNVGVERAAKNAGFELTIPFVGGRGDATQENTDIESFSHLEPTADGFLNWTISDPDDQDTGLDGYAEYLLIERASLLSLTPPEMVVLLAGLRSAAVVHRDCAIALPGSDEHTLDPGFLRNIVLASNYKWNRAPELHTPARYFIGSDYNPNKKTGISASRVDLLFASNSILRGISEIYAAKDGDEKMVLDFARVWNKIMMLDRFDIR